MPDQPSNQPDRTQRVLDRSAQEHGFSLAGVCSLEPSAWSQQFQAWLSDSKHGSMDYLEKNLELRLNPAQMLEGAQSAIVVGDLYATRADNTDSPLKPGQGRIARYARGKDYHKLIKKRLHALADALSAENPAHTFRAAVDTAPVLERELASRAGIGWTGKHTLTINPAEGSYLMLGVLFTTLKLTPEPSPITDHCGTCTRCIDACPTKAITPYSVDGTKCISYLTIEHREPIEPSLLNPIGDWLFGCDICQEVCPHNSPRQTQITIHEAYSPRRDRFDLLEILNWTEDDRREAFISSSMKRATLPMMKRNALIVLANQQHDPPERSMIEQFQSIANDESEDPLVNETACTLLNQWDSQSHEP